MLYSRKYGEYITIYSSLQRRKNTDPGEIFKADEAVEITLTADKFLY